MVKFVAIIGYTFTLMTMLITCLADREEGRLKGDMKRLNLEKDDHKDKRNTYEVRQLHILTH